MNTMTVSEAKTLPTDWGSMSPIPVGYRLLLLSKNGLFSYKFVPGEMIRYAVIGEILVKDGIVYQDFQPEEAILIEDPVN